MIPIFFILNFIRSYIWLIKNLSFPRHVVHITKYHVIHGQSVLFRDLFFRCMNHSYLRHMNDINHQDGFNDKWENYSILFIYGFDLAVGHNFISVSLYFFLKILTCTPFPFFTKWTTTTTNRCDIFGQGETHKVQVCLRWCRHYRPPVPAGRCDQFDLHVKITPMVAPIHDLGDS